MKSKYLKKPFALLAFTSLLIWSSCEQAAPPVFEPGEMKFYDEFNGSSLDDSKWSHDIGRGEWGWGNGELQYYRSENTTVSNGKAIITADTHEQYNYTSSKIKSKVDFKYGSVQARIKTVKGRGLWPAFWLLPTGGSWPCDGEIDIMEQGNRISGNTDAKVTTGAAHVGTCPYSSNTEDHEWKSFNLTSSESFANDFHVYEIRWEKNMISWLVDDVKVFQITPEDYPGKNWPFNKKDWYIILNLAIDSNGPDNNTVFPAQMEIDWVRVYELEQVN